MHDAVPTAEYHGRMAHRSSRILLLACCLSLFSTSLAARQAPPDPGPVPKYVAEPIKLFTSGLGPFAWKISTENPQAQAFFNQGVQMMFAFAKLDAVRSFREASKNDPECAMCYWGEALVLGPNINAPMGPDAAAPAYAAVSKAQALAAKATARERALIDALSARYSSDPNAERAALDRAYADAMSKAAKRFPQDAQIAVLTAEAIMDLSPWDYWEAAGAKPKERTPEALALLERVLKTNPDHPGAIHYYIHLVEASTDPKRAEPYADRLGKLMPGAGHLVHMPAHIYYRVGRYLDSLAVNKVAVAADEKYLATAAPSPIYRNGYYPHNVHFVMVSAQMAGDGPTAIRAAEKLDAILSAEAAREIPFVHPIKASPYFVHAQFSDPATVLALPDPGDALPYVKAMWHYARGVAHAARQDLVAAEAEVQAIERINKGAGLSGLNAGGIPANDVLALARQVLRGRIAQARGDLAEAIVEFEQAVAIEDKLAYMEPPYWYYPVRQSLGAALLLGGELDRAEQAFRTSLARTPNNARALYGLMEVYKKRGDASALKTLNKRFEKTWVGNRSDLDLGRL
jgi:tetratricopeptide (TPR) repeat protein